jgi:hypothetical protein
MQFTIHYLPFTIHYLKCTADLFFRKLKAAG